MAQNARISREHSRLLEEIAADTLETSGWTGRRELSAAVMASLARVPRERFISSGDRLYAFENRPLSIGFGQTISQPFIVAIMTDLLDLSPQDRVLEIGTGSGYQTAVLAEIASCVYSIETVSDLADEARRRLSGLGYSNIFLRVGDGCRGWPEAAPFDAIVVTAAPTEIPRALVEQLATGGRLVIPVGAQYESQMLYRCVKNRDGALDKERRLPVAFVPMVSGS